ncbi:MAG: hypothetical protein AABZ57_00785, partial [Candidatus Margulisiibacteriota bacterium]
MTQTRAADYWAKKGAVVFHVPVHTDSRRVEAKTDRQVIEKGLRRTGEESLVEFPNQALLTLKADELHTLAYHNMLGWNSSRYSNHWIVLGPLADRESWTSFRESLGGQKLAYELGPVEMLHHRLIIDHTAAGSRIDNLDATSGILLRNILTDITLPNFQESLRSLLGDTRIQSSVQGELALKSMIEAVKSVPVRKGYAGEFLGLCEIAVPAGEGATADFTALENRLMDLALPRYLASSLTNHLSSVFKRVTPIDDAGLIGMVGKEVIPYTGADSDEKLRGGIVSLLRKALSAEMKSQADVQVALALKEGFVPCESDDIPMFVSGANRVLETLKSWGEGPFMKSAPARTREIYSG